MAARPASLARAEADIDRRRAGIEELFQPVGERPFVRQDPGAGLSGVDQVRGQPRPQCRIAGEQHFITEDIVADIVQRMQAERCAVAVDRLTEQRVLGRDIMVPERSVVGHAGWKRMPRIFMRPVARRRQPDRTEGAKDVADAPLLSDQTHGGTGREEAARHHGIAAFGGRHERIVLPGDDLRRLAGDEFGHAFGRCRCSASRHLLHPFAHRREGRRQRHAGADAQRGKLLITGDAHPHLDAERVQRCPKGHHRLHVAARTVGRQ